MTTRCPFYLFIRGSDLIPRHSPHQHPGMLLPFFHCLVAAFKIRRELALENLALRQQLAVLRRSVKRPRVSDFHRGFWVLLSRIWRDWRRSLVLVKPETVIRWHRSGFRRYWTWKSRRRRPGRPPIDPDVSALIRKMSEANPRYVTPGLRSSRF